MKLAEFVRSRRGRRSAHRRLLRRRSGGCWSSTRRSSRGKSCGRMPSTPIYADIHRAAKESRPSVQVGFHIWHANSFSPFIRAEQDYAAFAKVADFLKIVLYNNCGGPRYVRPINSVASTICATCRRTNCLSCTTTCSTTATRKAATSCRSPACLRIMSHARRGVRSRT